MENINTGLVLGLNYGSSSSSGNMLPWISHHRRPEAGLHLERSLSNCITLDPALTLGLPDDPHEVLIAGEQSLRSALPLLELDRQLSPNYSVMTASFSDGRPTRVKKEVVETRSEETEKVLSQISDELLEEGSSRKKLRLTKEQSVLLEDKFKEQTTLNPRQKKALAKQLKLQPRQVEVWFQNRRARTKFKQAKIDCEVLRKCCERLMVENRRLRKELQELKACKPSPQLYMQPQAGTANYTMCPSCERITAAGGDDTAATALAVTSKLGFFKPFAPLLTRGMLAEEELG